MKYLPFITSTLIIFLGTGAIIAYAQDYRPLAPLPGTFTGSQGSEVTNMALYVSGTIKLLIALGAALAVLYAIIGGVQYVAVSINPSAKADALGKVTNALLGLAIILTSYLLLNSINPTLVNVSFKLPSVTVGAKEPQPLTVVSGTQAGFCSSVTPFSLTLNTPAGQQMESLNGKAVIFASTDAVVNANLKKLQAEVDKLQNALSRIGASAKVNSAYRPYEYQKHLWQLFHAWKEQGLESSIDPACGPIKTAIGREYQKHGLGSLVSNPDTQSSPHVNGTGVDIELTGITYDEINSFMTQRGIKLRWQNISGDTVHFNLVQ